MEPFHERLRILMEQRGMSQSELARRSGFHQSAISRWLSEGRAPEAESIKRVADALEADPMWEFVEYRRWGLHRELDIWIDRDEETVGFLLARLAPAEGPRE